MKNGYCLDACALIAFLCDEQGADYFCFFENIKLQLLKLLID